MNENRITLSFSAIQANSSARTLKIGTDDLGRTGKVLQRVTAPAPSTQVGLATVAAGNVYQHSRCLEEIVAHVSVLVWVE